MQLSNNELTTFFDQMAMVLHSGISAIEGISMMREDIDSKDGLQVLDTIYKSLEETGNFYTALSDSGVFPEYALELVNIGEQTGHLEKVSRSLAVYYQREEDVKKNIKGAITYPLIMIGMMAVIILVLIIKVLPMFNEVFVQLGGELSGFSRSMMNIGTVLSRYSFVFVIILVIIAGVVIYFGYTKNGNKNIKKFSANFILTRKLSSKMAASKFASGMALTIGSGLDIEQSLSMTAALIGESALKAKAEGIITAMKEGESFPKALEASQIFSGVYSRMVSIGYKTGNMDELMNKIAAQYEDEIDTHLNRIISFLEPTLVAILSIIVGMILLSVMLPLLSIMSNIG